MQINRTFVIEKHTFNPRNARLEPFVKRVNDCRIQAKYKPWTPAYIASLMSHIPTDDLDAFYKKLDNSNNFCKLWYWHVKPKKK